MQCFELNRGHPEAECFRVAFLKLSSHLAGSLGYDKKPYDRQLSEMLVDCLIHELDLKKEEVKE